MHTSLTAIGELARRRSPAPYPQALAHDGTSLWMGSRETRHLYGIDTSKWSVFKDAPAPGTPWGMTAAGGDLRVVCGEPPDDNRFIRRYSPNSGFDGSRIACPEDTGSYLCHDGEHLYVTQWYNQRVIQLDDDGSVRHTTVVPHGICGAVAVEGDIYLLTTDDENSDDYWLTRISKRGQAGLEDIRDVARVPFKARSLAWDGEKFWSNHREQHEIVAFERPDR